MKIKTITSNHAKIGKGDGFLLKNTETMISITPGTRNSAARTSAIVENGADPILQFEKKYE